ncbi:hypothetical protein ACVWXL_009091 [Bradyrhizobium sp. GM22.5]
MRKVAIGIRGDHHRVADCALGYANSWHRAGISSAIVTGAICAVAMLYGSVAQRESNASNEFKDHVISLSQTFLESGQIATLPAVCHQSLRSGLPERGLGPTKPWLQRD